MQCLPDGTVFLHVIPPLSRPFEIRAVQSCKTCRFTSLKRTGSPAEFQYLHAIKKESRFRNFRKRPSTAKRGTFKHVNALIAGDGHIKTACRLLHTIKRNRIRQEKNDCSALYCGAEPIAIRDSISSAVFTAQSGSAKPIPSGEQKRLSGSPPLIPYVILSLCYSNLFA